MADVNTEATTANVIKESHNTDIENVLHSIILANKSARQNQRQKNPINHRGTYYTTKLTLLQYCFTTISKMRGIF